MVHVAIHQWEKNTGDLEENWTGENQHTTTTPEYFYYDLECLNEDGAMWLVPWAE